MCLSDGRGGDWRKGAQSQRWLARGIVQDLCQHQPSPLRQSRESGISLGVFRLWQNHIHDYNPGLPIRKARLDEFSESTPRPWPRAERGEALLVDIDEGNGWVCQMATQLPLHSVSKGELKTQRQGGAGHLSSSGRSHHLTRPEAGTEGESQNAEPQETA